MTNIGDSVGGALTESYDGLDRLTSESSPQGSAAITYDNANRRTTLTLSNGIKLSYGYDNANELTGLTYMLGSTTVGSLTYGYDNDGRIMMRGGTFDVTNLPTTLASAVYDANNRLTNWGSKTLNYDADGNLSGDGTNTYTWNTRNQLTAISGGSTGSFVYDALGRRESKTISGTATNFLYDGLNLEQDLNGTTPTVNYLTGAGIDEVFSRTDSTGSHSYLTDNLGSSMALTNTSGAISTSYSYEPYGNTTATGTTSSNALQYTGRENDSDGLYYYYFRYYDPTIGRFISSDPIGLRGGVNTYAYGLNNPLSFSDPTGTAVYIYSDQVTGLTSPASDHLYLMLIPDNPQDFSNEGGWLPLGNGDIWASLSAHPEFGLFGNLTFTPDYSGNDFGGLYRATVQPPCGESDTQFIRALIHAADFYDDNLPYSYPNFLTGQMAPGTYNSNSFVSGIITAAGGVPPSLPSNNTYQVPGYQNPIPNPIP